MASPTSDPNRLPTLDFVRGVAVMGILLMNIQSFALPEAAYSNPRAYGGWHGADLAAWWVEAVLVDGKMRGLFSWLFGASALLVAMRAQAAGESGLRVHYRRMAWLALFGLAHLLIVWDGDILLHYALVGSLAFLFRDRPPHALVTAAVLLIAAQIVVVLPVPIALSDAVASVAAGHPSAVAVQDLPGWRDQFGVPSPASIAEALALHRGPYSGLLAYRLGEAPQLVFGTLTSVGLETLAYMLFGMAALRSGMFAGEWPRAAYRRGALIGFGVGIPATLAITAWERSSGFDLCAVAWAALVWTAPVRAAMIAGWACLLVPLAGPGWLRERVTAAGRMAFSNYLGTSLVCAGLFDGLGLFGAFSRAALLGVVVAVWAAMLLWSRPWLRRYRYGPLEWIWRSLARGAPQPMRLT